MPLSRLSSYLLCLIAVASICASPLHAASRPTLLVLGEDGDPDMVRRNSRVFNLIIAATESQLFDYGYDVYKEPVLSAERFNDDGGRRDYQDLVAISRGITAPPIDVAVIVSVYASLQQTEFANDVDVRIMGEMVNVQSGKFLGNFQVTAGERAWNAPQHCDRECVLETVGEYARRLGNELGYVLGTKLRNLELRHAGQGHNAPANGLIKDYTLVFENFTPQEQSHIRNYLKIYSGIKHYRSIENRGVYWRVFYQSSISVEKLEINLRETFRQLDLNTHITFSGQQFNVTKTGRHRIRRDRYGSVDF